MIKPLGIDVHAYFFPGTLIRVVRANAARILRLS